MRVTVIRSKELDKPAAAAIRAAGLGALLRRCGDQLGVPAASGLSLRLTDDVELARLNLGFLGADAPTDVLAFPAGEAGYVGDIAISVPRGLAQAPDGDGAAELRLLAVHGLLHCLGHDHAEPAEAREMSAATRRLLPDQTVPELRPAGPGALS